MEQTENWATYRPPHPSLLDAGLVCLGAGEQTGKFPSFFNRTLNSHALVIVTKGKGRVWGSEGMRAATELKSPAYFWVEPGQSHGYGPSAEGWSEHWMLISGAITAAFAQLGVLTRSMTLTPYIFYGIDISVSFAQLRVALELEGPAGDMAASSLCMKHIAELVGTSKPSEDVVLQLLREQALNSIPLALHARNLGISETELHRRVFKATGISPKAFIVQLRLQKAQALLTETLIPINEVARRIGYDDPAYFSRFFTRHVGSPPSIFRAQQKRG